MGELGVFQQYDLLSQYAAPSVQRLFNTCLERGKYVEEGSDCPSLGAILVRRASLRVDENNKVRCSFRDGAGVRYEDVKVTCDWLNTSMERDAVGTVHRVVPTAGWGGRRVLLRLGLAGPWPGREEWASYPFDPQRCYLQVNGVFVLGE